MMVVMPLALRPIFSATQSYNLNFLISYGISDVPFKRNEGSIFAVFASSSAFDISSAKMLKYKSRLSKYRLVFLMRAWFLALKYIGLPAYIKHAAEQPGERNGHTSRPLVSPAARCSTQVMTPSFSFFATLGFASGGDSSLLIPASR